ncbi:MAG: hypothetical protein GY854_12780, partial [Deltaproteobacteria bacterium]|nr:hypothetical protein [Deltaproteobacteria bacterium]
MQKLDLNKRQVGYSTKKLKLHKQRLAEDQSELMGVEKVQLVADDEDKYDTEAELESDQLEKSLGRERDSQAQRKKKHRQDTEKRDGRIIFSQKERARIFNSLAEQLTTSEQAVWRDQWRKRDQLQTERTRERYRHFFVDNKGLLYPGDALYSKRKQSTITRFMKESTTHQFEDWESTSEYDTDIEEELVRLTTEVGERVQGLQELQAAQLPEDQTAQEVQLVVSTVATEQVPDIWAKDMEVDSTVPPAPTMGPGMAAADTGMPSIFDQPAVEMEETELTDYEESDGEQQQPRLLPALGFFRHPMDQVD